MSACHGLRRIRIFAPWGHISKFLKKAKGGPPLPAPALRGLGSFRSALLETISLVAAAAIVLADIAHGGFEAVEILHRGVRGFGILAELVKFGLEVGHVFP